MSHLARYILKLERYDDSTCSSACQKVCSKEIKSLVQLEGISINQFLTLAAAERSAVRSVQLNICAEGALGSRADFGAFLAAIPDQEPEDDDRID
ncbi:MAG: hypothetical protein R2911_43890 [Caldilineaceae bacterium]